MEDKEIDKTHKIEINVNNRGLIELSAAIAQAIALMQVERVRDSDTTTFYHAQNTLRHLLTEIHRQLGTVDTYTGSGESFCRNAQLFF